MNGRTFTFAGLAVFFAAMCCDTVQAADGRPFAKFGIVNCALPGTIINFSLDGSGAADVESVSSNYEPFRVAADVKTWSANIVDDDGMRILVLDNHRQTRIMVSFPEGKGFAYAYPEGVSDILCQILIRPD